MKSIFSLCAAALLSFATLPSAHATPITYTLTGSGNVAAFLGGDLVDAPFTWTVTGDTANLTTFAGYSAVPALTNVLNISGIGALIPTLSMVAFGVPSLDPGIGAVAFADPTGAGVSWRGPALFGYDITTPIGPIPVTLLEGIAFGTDHGAFTLQRVENLTFTATLHAVPEPGSLLLLLIGIAGLVGLRVPTSRAV